MSAIATMNEDDEPLRDDVERLFASAAEPLPESVRGRAAEVARAARPGGGLAAGTAVGPYEVADLIAAGGQATVYTARHRETGRRVALKIPRGEKAARLVREAQILFTLEDPRIVRIEAAASEPVPYLALELLAGSLADELRTQAGRGLPIPRVRRMAEDVLAALDYAHGRGVVHRDVKPANILFDESGRAKLADFGIGALSLAARGEAPLSNTLARSTVDGATALAGTPAYMAPEQERGQKVDGRADLFSLGKVLYECLTGRSPRTVRPASHYRPHLGAGWDAFIFRLVEDDPEDRFDDARAALAALVRLPNGPPVQTSPAASARSGATSPLDIVGRTIDRYRILKFLGEGGFGAVYKAEHTLLKSMVAFKLLYREHALNPLILQRFLREGQVSGRFKHKHAVDIYDFGPMGDGSYFMALEFLPGADVRELLKKKGSLGLAQAFDILLMTLSAMQAAHDGGVVHRDIKPDNIKLERRDGHEDHVKVFDFGIARLIDRLEKTEEPTDRMTAEQAKRIADEVGREAKAEPPPGEGYRTQVGAFFGTPEYASPEQCAGDAVDARSDIYTLGVVLYEVLTGSLPFVSRTPQGYLAQHMVATPRPILEVAPQLRLPRDVETIIAKAMEKRRELRYQSCAEFAAAIIACAKKHGIPIRIEDLVRGLPLWRVLLPIGLALALILGGVEYYRRFIAEDPAARAQGFR